MLSTARASRAPRHARSQAAAAAASAEEGGSNAEGGGHAHTDFATALAQAERRSLQASWYGWGPPILRGGLPELISVIVRKFALVRALFPTRLFSKKKPICETTGCKTLPAPYLRLK